MPRPVPHYWWDYADQDGVIIIESDYDEFPIVGKITYSPANGADEAIELSEWYIGELMAGRKNPRELFVEVI